MTNNFYDNFFKVVESFPNKVALEFHGTSVSYAALDNSVRCFENNLMELGLKKGDRIIAGIEKIAGIYLPISFLSKNLA